jgi:hypothetical protein
MNEAVFIMFNSDTELFFPIRVIPSLSGIRGIEWDALIDRLSKADTDEIEQIAFTGLVVKLAGCAGCDADSFRAMRGCTQCAKLVLKRYKGTDDELVVQFEQSKNEVSEFLKKRKE